MKQEAPKNKNICNSPISSEDKQMQAPPTTKPERQNVPAMEESKASQPEKTNKTLEKIAEPPQQKKCHRRKKEKVAERKTKEAKKTKQTNLKIVQETLKKRKVQ